MQSRLGAATLHVVPDMPEKTEKQQAGFRLSAGVIRRINALADRLELDRADVIDLAIKHLDGTIARDQALWVSDPPPPPTPEPKRLGGPRDAA